MKTLVSLLIFLVVLVSCARERESHFANVPPTTGSNESPTNTEPARIAPGGLTVEVNSPLDPDSIPLPSRRTTGVVTTAGTVEPPSAGEGFTQVEPGAAARDQGVETTDTNAAVPVPGVNVAVPGATPGVPTDVPAVPGGAVPDLPGGITAGVDATGEPILAPGMIDFRNAPLESVLDFYAKLVNRTLLRPATIAAQQQITLKTQTDLTRAEAIQALDTVLGMNGLAMINEGEKFVKVVPLVEAPSQAAPPDTRSANELPDIGQYLTHIRQLKYVKPSEIQQILQPFARIPNSILAIDSSQILVLRDFTENVKRMLELIDRVDIAVPAEFISEVIPIKYAKASEIAEALNALGGGGSSTSIGGQQQTQRATGAAGMRSGLPGTQGMNQPGMQNTLGAQGAQGTSSPFMGRLQSLVRRATASGELQILGETKMIADERSNSLMIFATRQDMEMIKNIISKLDVVLAQVMIETVIMDVNLNDTLSYGVSAGQHPKSGSQGTIGGVYNNSGQLGTLADFFSQTLTNGTFPTSSGLSYFGRYKGDLDLAIQAAASDSRVNIVQKPRILTSHAKTGQLFIGSTVPYVTGTTYGGYGGPSSYYQQLRVGIGLNVTPYINPDGLVVMEIEQQIQEVSGSIELVGVGAVPTTTDRSLYADIAVRDGDTIILGGFIRNSSDKRNAGVPILKDIPLLGVLFSSRASTKTRSELLVMMRPTVLETPEIAALASTQEKERMPGVVAAEEENLELERKLLERARKSERRGE